MVFYVHRGRAGARRRAQRREKGAESETSNTEQRGVKSNTSLTTGGEKEGFEGYSQGREKRVMWSK